MLTVILSNTDEEVGLSSVFSYQGGKEYSVDAKVGIREQKKKIFFEPLVHIKTPKKDMPILAGTIEYRRSRMIILNLKLAGFIQPSIVKCKYFQHTIILKCKDVQSNIDRFWHRQGPHLFACVSAQVIP